MIDVHKLAGELGVSGVVVMQAVAELGGTASSGSTLTEELAGQVRDHLRAPKRGFVGSGGSPMFSVRPAHTVVARPEGQTVAPAFPRQDDAQRPPLQAQAHDPFGVRETGTALGRETGIAREGDHSHDATTIVYAQQDELASHLVEQSELSVLAEQWRAAGLGRHYQHIVEQCQRYGLTPEDVRRRVDGQTIASRLKNGESISSVRSRIAQSN